MGFIDSVRNKFRDYVGESEGTAGTEMQGGIRDPKPYRSYYSNGLFVGNDGTLWLYFRMPEDVKVEWTKSYEESANNQMFLTRVFDALARTLTTTQSTRKDDRMKFHISMVREITDKITKYPGITPAEADYLSRMEGAPHPVWHSYFGVQLKMGSINSDVYGISNKFRHYIDFMMSKVDVEYNLYKESIQTVTSVCLDNGLTPLDFVSHPEDFERLTAWFGESDRRYGIQKELESTPLETPDHGKSIFCGLGELTMYAIKPKESRDMFASDPFDPVDVRFGRTLMYPSLNNVHINIRGEIRNPTTAENIFDDKTTNTLHKQAGKDSVNASVGERAV